MTGADITDYNEFFIAEDARLAEIETLLAAREPALPNGEISQVIDRLKVTGTASVSGTGYHVIRDPFEYFKIVEDQTAHPESELSHAA